MTTTGQRRCRVEQARDGDRVCDVDGCGNLHYAKGMCKRHWTATRPRRDPYTGTCTVDECDRKARPGRMCTSHQRRADRGEMDVPVRGYEQVGCLFDGCDDEHYKRGVCQRHFRGGRIGRSVAGKPFAAERELLRELGLR